MIPNYYVFTTDTSDISIALLIKEAAFTREAIKSNYLQDTELIPKIVALPLKYEAKNKVSSKFMEEYIAELLPELSSIGIKTIYCADSNYFKYLTKKTITTCMGSISECRIKGYEHIQIIPGVNYQAIFHNPSNKGLLEVSLDTLVQHVSGYDVSKPKDIIKSAKYLYMHSGSTPEQYTEALKELQAYVELSEVSIDIETKGLRTDIEKSALRFDSNEIASIAFSKSNSEGICIYFDGNNPAKFALKSWFEQRAKFCESNISARNIYHNCLFDIKQLIYHLFMAHPGDIPGLLYGISAMTKNIDDTMIMQYLCTNNAQENDLKLKSNTLSYTGQYAVDVTDVSLLPIPDLMEYNLKDVLATKWLYDKLIKEIVTENQEDIYREVFLPAIPVLLEMMLVGLPLNMEKVAEVEAILTAELEKSLEVIENLPLIHEYNEYLQNKAMNTKNASLKKKVVTIVEFKHITFNPGSPNQKMELLYEGLGLPVLDYTKTKQPATGNKTIVKLVAYAVENGLDPAVIQLLKALKDHTDVSKILNTFISAFKHFAFHRGDNTVWLNGDQILCGTISGRLGSRSPNLANLPSNSRFGKLIKSCFQAPDGWLFVGADFSALEDRIVAILSDDPMKKKPFTEGIDGHCLNAYGYFKDQMQGITEDNLNDIKDNYPDLRQESKAPTFA